MKKIGLFIPILIIIGILGVGCSREKNLFTESGLDKVHIEKLIVTNEATKKVTDITNGDPVGQFLDEISSIKLEENKNEEAANAEEGHSGGCNVPGKNTFYIELQDASGAIVGDLTISKDGDVQVTNFKNKYIKMVSNKEAALRLTEIIKKENV